MPGADFPELYSEKLSLTKCIDSPYDLILNLLLNMFFPVRYHYFDRKYMPSSFRSVNLFGFFLFLFRYLLVLISKGLSAS